MSTSAILLAILLGSGVLAVTLLPLFAREEEESPLPVTLRGTDRQNRALETLWAEKTRVLRSIRDLDFDYDMGKLSPEMYIAQRENLIRFAVAIMRRMDTLQAEIAAQQARVADAVAEFRQQVRKSQA